DADAEGGQERSQRLGGRELAPCGGVEEVSRARHVARVIGQLQLPRVPEAEAANPGQAEGEREEQRPPPGRNAAKTIPHLCQALSVQSVVAASSLGPASVPVAPPVPAPPVPAPASVPLAPPVPRDAPPVPVSARPP